MLLDPCSLDPCRPDTLAGLTAFMQPIVHLTSGRVVGFEALARVQRGGAVLAPAQFLSGLTDAERIALFTRMVGLAGRFVTALRTENAELYVSVNVEGSLLLREDFCDRVAALAPPSTAGLPALVLEITESEGIADLERAARTLLQLKAMGVGAALDDLGTAYSSLLMLKSLPLDIVKLDQSFARDLANNPDGLPFAHSILTLARGLGCRLVVEGMETAAIAEALALLGVEYGQGYAIAKPMPAAHACRWLRAHRPKARGRAPSSLLGAYAAHHTVVETCRILATQPLSIRWTAEARDPHACAIGRYFDDVGLGATPCGLAHERFHDVIDLFAEDAARWSAAAEDFRRELKLAMRAEREASPAARRQSGWPRRRAAANRATALACRPIAP